MNMFKVRSSNVSHIGYENGTLAVRFMNGSEYHYDGIKPEVFDEMRATDSPGSYLRSIVMPAAARVRRVT